MDFFRHGKGIASATNPLKDLDRHILRVLLEKLLKQGHALRHLRLATSTYTKSSGPGAKSGILELRLMQIALDCYRSGY